MEQDLKPLLLKYWGYETFRAPQENIIRTAMKGQDVLAILPTGSGKSLCYQLPALALPGMALVVTPLIALMQDQVYQLKKKDVSAACIHSGLRWNAINEILQEAVNGKYKLLYISPERLQSKRFLSFLKDMNISLVAIDEAHCISQWGHDFRPSYLKIADIKPHLNNDIAWLALTATATPLVQEEIKIFLKLPHATLFKKSVFRENLSYQVLETENKLNKIADLFQNIKGSGILYLNSRQKCLEMRRWLQDNGIKALAYHAGMSKTERQLLQSQWMRQPNRVMCATSAFGMGIDKGDVRIVAHLSPPDSVEDYYQQAGRAGRDGQDAQCVLFYAPNDIVRLKEAPDVHYPSRKFVHAVYRKLNDFLQIPLNTGQDESFPFDILKFVKNFDLPLMPTISAIRILAKNEYWIWEEQSHQSSFIRILANEEDLATLKSMQPQLSKILTGVMRLHSGVFNFPVPLKLWDLTKYLGMEQSRIVKNLNQLKALEIIDYQPGRTGDFLYFLHHRVRANELRLDVKRVKRLKKAYKERVQSMLTYLSDKDTCRHILLADYFGEKNNAPCGQCDICLKKGRPHFSEAEIRRKICERLQHHSNNDLQNLSSHFPAIDNGRIIQQLRILQNDGFCRIQPNGKILLQ